MESHIDMIAIAAALAWASGIRLYALLFLLGLAGHFHWFDWNVPSSLGLLTHPLVIGTNGILLTLEFFADKIPGIDSLWDGIHTFIRIPAGALLAAGVINEADGAAWALAAALLGGSITAGTHFLKAGGRAAINTSPEPVSNWFASFSEDALVIAGIWLAFQHPWIFLALLAVFLLLVVWMVPKLFRLAWKLVRQVFGRSAATAGG